MLPEVIISTDSGLSSDHCVSVSGTMAATNLGTRNDPSMNDMDNSLFDYDVDDVFLDVDTNMDVPAMQKAATTADRKETGAGLGIDEEIKVTQKRVPIPKLDENRFAPSRSATVY